MEDGVACVNLPFLVVGSLRRAPGSIPRPARRMKAQRPPGGHGPQKAVWVEHQENSGRHRRPLQVSRGDSPFNRERRYLLSEGEVKAENQSAEGAWHLAAGTDQESAGASRGSGMESGGAW